MQLHNSSSEKWTYFKTHWIAWFASWGKAGQSCQEGGCSFFIWEGLEKTHWWEATIGWKEECVKSLAEDLLQPSVPKEEGLRGFTRLGELRWQKMLRRQKRKRSREIFLVLFGSYILQQKPPLSAHGRSLQHAEMKPVLPNRQCIYHSFTAGYTHGHPRTQPCHRSLQADPTAYSQSSACPAAGAPHCRLPYSSPKLITPVKCWYNAVISETREGMKKWLTQHVKPLWCKPRVNSWQGHTLNQIQKTPNQLCCLEIHSSTSLWRELSIGQVAHKIPPQCASFPNHWDVYRRNCLGIQAFPSLKVEDSKSRFLEIHNQKQDRLRGGEGEGGKRRC